MEERRERGNRGNKENGGRKVKEGIDDNGRKETGNQKKWRKKGK